MRKGLFIGINDYDHVSRLSGCSNDAMAMASVLKTDADGDPNFKNIVLTSAEDYLSREKLEDQIRELFSGDCNVALLYFVHSSTMPSAPGSSDPCSRPTCRNSFRYVKSHR